MSVGLDAYTAAEVIEFVSRTGVTKGNMRLDKVFLSSVSAGCLLAFACGTALSTNTSSWFQENAPGLIRTIGALVFPYGLCMIILTGADLCTGSFMYTTVAALQRQIPWWRMLLHWFITFWGNLCGSLFVVAIIFGYGNVFAVDPYKSEAISFATKKQVTPEFQQIFVRGIGCNWLVCLACFFGLQGRDLASKVIGIWWPIFAFVSLGLDHVVANMTFIPLSIWLEAPGITVGLYIWKGIIPTLLGNIVGGGLFVGTYYWYMYLVQGEWLTLAGLRRQYANSSETSAGNGVEGRGDVEAEAGVVDGNVKRDT
ncbi:Formate/nitrite transporter [Aspergillus heteromorphus CBS 117.55]|uniref:Formate/nitrite transporter n=1 Tax=Aspergillus heteromorphus CBS 117.55 TaxID=1448321 RepID=A0A317WED6_9EURO|nr:Formate/nitrite transporter [Aspergillus heteromorphus CBS 117.55]PWY83607.1 Formate/nitrite transporter [Aspergillus heteromorphus CBS 117.55]